MNAPTTDLSTQQRTLTILREAGALCDGHFLLSSGLHSDRYCQCAAVFEQPERGAELARLMGERLLKDVSVDAVLAPALGGILWGHELARAIGARSLFAERSEGGSFALRRGFEIAHGSRVLVAEDVVTTGKSAMEMTPLIQAAEAKAVGYAVIADRSSGIFSPDAPFYALTKLDFEIHNAATCPMCARGDIPVKPGSRKGIEA